MTADHFTIVFDKNNMAHVWDRPGLPLEPPDAPAPDTDVDDMEGDPLASSKMLGGVLLLGSVGAGLALAGWLLGPGKWADALFWGGIVIWATWYIRHHGRGRK